MSDRPILFSAPMVLALLGDRKTQTRRVIKGVPMFSADYDRQWSPNVIPPGGAIPNEWSWWEGPPHGQSCYHRARISFAVGDRLWVKETWQTGSGFNGPQIAYRATGDRHDIEAWDGEDEGDGPSFNYERCPGAKWHTWLPDLLNGVEGIWRPSRYMPRWASRLTLLVTDVRVERLQDISDANAQAEGAVPRSEAGLMASRPYEAFAVENYRDAFQRIWSSINGPEAWAANPWVAAVTFSVHACNIDDPAAPVGLRVLAGADA